MSVLSLAEIFQNLPLEDKTIILGTIRHCISKRIQCDGYLQGSVSGEIWLLLLETLEEK